MKPVAKIVRLESRNGIETYKWLCPKHLSESLASGWQLRETKPDPPHSLSCQVCDVIAQVPADDDEALFE